MRLRHSAILFPLALPLAFSAQLLSPRAAEAQVSESERAAARTLFQEGDTFQQSGRYVEALDKFRRAESLFAAPTNLIRMGQCETALGHLVAAAEHYRAIRRMQLPQGAPAAFTKAFEDAAGALQLLEPRIPHLKIDVRPANATGFKISVDGQAINPAVLGEPLPLDPTNHTVSVTAPGFAPVERAIQLQEKDSKSITFALRSSNGAGTAPVYPQQQQQPTYPQQPAQPTYVQPQPTYPQQQPAYVQPRPYAPQPPPPAPPPSPAEPEERGLPLLLGLRLSAEVPAGKLGSYTNVNGATGASVTSATAQSDLVGVGGGVAADVGLRFLRHFYAGASVAYASYNGVAHAAGGDGGNFLPPASSGRTDNGLTRYGTTGADTVYAGIVLGYVSSPSRFGFFGTLGLGYRELTVQVNDVAFMGNSNGSAVFSGPEAELAAGLWIPLGRAFRLVPRVAVSGGTYSSFSYTDPSNVSTSTTLSSGSHMFVSIGLGGYYTLFL